MTRDHGARDMRVTYIKESYLLLAAEVASEDGPACTHARATHAHNWFGQVNTTDLELWHRTCAEQEDSIK